MSACSFRLNSTARACVTASPPLDASSRSANASVTSCRAGMHRTGSPSHRAAHRFSTVRSAPMAETTNARSHPARMDFEVRVRRLRLSRLRRCGQKQSRVTRTSRTMVGIECLLWRFLGGLKNPFLN